MTYTSTTRTAVSGYAESISLYKDADCFEDMGLSGAVVSVSVGKADTTKTETSLPPSKTCATTTMTGISF